MNEKIRQIRHETYLKSIEDAVLTEHCHCSIYDTHMNVFTDGRERGLWLGVQDDRDIEKAIPSTFPGHALLLEWDQIETLYNALGEQLKNRKPE